jgi:hypothetical protein
MTSHFRFDPDDPSPSRLGASTVAVSIATAVLAGLVLLAQTAPGPEPAVPRAEPRAKAPAASLDSGIDWSRVEPAAEHPGAAVGAYDR